jgi:hypothetical protein
VIDGQKRWGATTDTKLILKVRNEVNSPRVRRLEVAGAMMERVGQGWCGSGESGGGQSALGVAENSSVL